MKKILILLIIIGFCSFSFGKDDVDLLDRLDQKETILVNPKSPFSDFDQSKKNLDKKILELEQMVSEKKIEILKKIENPHEIKIVIEQKKPHVVHTINFILDGNIIFDHMIYYPLSMDGSSIPIFDGFLPDGKHELIVKFNIFDSPIDSLEEKEKIFEKFEEKFIFSISKKEKIKFISIEWDLKTKKLSLKETSS